MKVIVTSKTRAVEVLKDLSRLHGVISICGNPEGPHDGEGERPHGLGRVPNDRKLICTFDDSFQGTGSPTRKDVEDILAFGRRFPSRWEHVVLVHCTAGMSRSPAAALAILTQDAVLHARGMGLGSNGVDFEQVYDALLAGCDRFKGAQDDITPNRVMVQHTDDILQLGGKLVAMRNEKVGTVW